MLQLAAADGTLDDVRRAMEEPDTDIDSRDENGLTALMLSVIRADPAAREKARFLLRRGANPFLHDLDGQTAISHASLLGMHELVIEMATAVGLTPGSKDLLSQIAAVRA